MKWRDRNQRCAPYTTFELAVNICSVQLLLQCVMLRYIFVTFFTNMCDDYDLFFTNVSNFFHLIFDFASIFTHYCDNSGSFDVEGTVVEGTAEIQPTCFLFEWLINRSAQFLFSPTHSAMRPSNRQPPASCGELVEVSFQAWWVYASTFDGFSESFLILTVKFYLTELTLSLH